MSEWFPVRLSVSVRERTCQLMKKQLLIWFSARVRLCTRLGLTKWKVAQEQRRDAGPLPALWFAKDPTGSVLCISLAALPPSERDAVLASRLPLPAQHCHQVVESVWIRLPGAKQPVSQAPDACRRSGGASPGDVVSKAEELSDITPVICSLVLERNDAQASQYYIKLQMFCPESRTCWHALKSASICRDGQWAASFPSCRQYCVISYDAIQFHFRAILQAARMAEWYSELFSASVGYINHSTTSIVQCCSRRPCKRQAAGSGGRGPGEIQSPLNAP